MNGIIDSAIDSLSQNTDLFLDPLTPGDPTLHDEPPESSIASISGGRPCNTPTPLDASTTPINPGVHSLVLTPATTMVSEPEAQKCDSVTDKKDSECSGPTSSTNDGTDGRCGDPGNLIDIPSDNDDEMLDTVKLSFDEPFSRKIAGETLQTRLDTLIENLLPAVTGFQCSEETIKRFNLGNRLNEDAIMLVLKLILPKEAEPLIASFAIRNRPPSLCHRYTEPDTSKAEAPTLKHNMKSTYLFIACNVQTDSLDCNLTGSGNHWILIVVDFDQSKVHVFGTEGGHKAEAEAIAYNVSLFVNNYRRSNRIDPVDWSSLEAHPVR